VGVTLPGRTRQANIVGRAHAPYGGVKKALTFEAKHRISRFVHDDSGKMSQPLNQSPASADDLQEALRAVLIMVSLIIDQIERGEPIERGHFSKMLGLIDEMTLQKAAGEHPAGSGRLALGLIRELQSNCAAAPSPDAEAKRWTPVLLKGGRE
jgi:hypothetical protein